MEEDAKCLEEAENVVRWSLEHIRAIRADEHYICAFDDIAKLAQGNLESVKSRVLDYDKHEHLHNEKADMQELILQAIAEYLCGFRIRVAGFKEYEVGRYSAVSDIAYWLQMIYGRLSSSLAECQNSDYLIWYFDTPIHGAWMTYQPTKKSLLELMNRLMRPVKELIKKSNRHSYEITDEYLMKEYDNKTNEELMSNIRGLMMDVDCCHTDQNLMYLSSLLLREEMYEEWISVMQHLRYPLLQGHILCHILKPTECISLIKALENSDDERKLVNQAILRQKWYDSICMVTENLRDDHARVDIDEELIKETEKRRVAWDKSLANNIESFLLLSKDIFGEEETLRWASALPYFGSERDALSCRVKNEIRNSVIDCCSDKFDLQAMSADGKSIDYLLVLLSHAVSVTVVDSKRVKQLVSELFNVIHASKCFLKGSKVSNDELLLLTKLCKGLSLLNEDSRQTLFSRFNITHEGYNAHNGVFTKGELNKHAFVLSAKLLLVCEEPFDTNKEQAIDYFKSVTNEVMDNYTHLLHGHSENAYLYPMIVGMLIASQKLSFDKWYTDMVVDKVDNFIDVLTILAQGKEVLDADVISKLQHRKCVEWPLWEVVFNDTTRVNEIQMCENIMSKLKLK